MTYHVIGFDPSIKRFSKQYLLLVCINQMASGLFRSIAALGRDMTVANTFGSFGLLSDVWVDLFCQEICDICPLSASDEVKKWWKWGYWISPMMYGQNAMAVNEFLGNSWKDVLRASIGFVFLFNLMFTLALSYLNPFGKPRVVISGENPVEKHSDRKGKFIELSHNERGAHFKRSVSSESACSTRSSSNVANHNKKQGMVLPFVPLSLSFDEISYAVDMPQETNTQGFTEDRLELLKVVSGAFRPGVLTTLMGVSGAGKTTLMDVLAGRKTGGYIEGSIMISGYPKKQEIFARISGYCEQTDIHSPHITVYESLLYSAWLRLPPEVDTATRKMFIKEVMDLVELTSLSEALVGLPSLNGLSTEQRKRLTIAVELVANPSIIFMDEPTSSLDARAAAIVMRTIRKQWTQGELWYAPSTSQAFDAFDELYLLKRRGEEIYVGPIGHQASYLITSLLALMSLCFLKGIRGVSKIRDGYNPATWMLEVTAAAQETALGVNFTDVFKNSELYRRNKAMIKELSKPQPGSKDLYFPTRYSQSFLNQSMACLWKQHWSYWRNPQYSAVRLLFTIFIALMFGTIFWDLGSKRRRQQDIFNVVGSMYSAALFIGIQNAALVQPAVAVERTVFYRERAAGMYSALPYAFGLLVIEFAYILVQAVIYGGMVYAVIGYERTVTKFLWNLFFTFFTFFGMMTMAITPNKT
ncbi:hypothetical protein SLA2020_336430 [Shorea laevis]